MRQQEYCQYSPYPAVLHQHLRVHPSTLENAMSKYPRSYVKSRILLPTPQYLTVTARHARSIAGAKVLLRTRYTSYRLLYTGGGRSLCKQAAFCSLGLFLTIRTCTCIYLLGMRQCFTASHRFHTRTERSAISTPRFLFFAIQLICKPKQAAQR